MNLKKNKWKIIKGLKKFKNRKVILNKFKKIHKKD